MWKKKRFSTRLFSRCIAYQQLVRRTNFDCVHDIRIMDRTGQKNIKKVYKILKKQKSHCRKSGNRI